LRTQAQADRQQQKKLAGKGAPGKKDANGSSQADMVAKIEALEKQLAAALALNSNASFDLTKDWMMAGTT